MSGLTEIDTSRGLERKKIERIGSLKIIRPKEQGIAMKFVEKSAAFMFLLRDTMSFFE